ncbi:MAG: PAS domain-containing protein [Gemmatimonadaceae bacterium]|nr:PAS domain-containing protein [Gemmatimonadaceae bacterium]MCW5824963.1 PAS domain-containing protein [Gemmatimonadaceae bacterium]
MEPTRAAPQDSSGVALALDDSVCRRTLDRMLEGCQIIGPDLRYLYVNDAVVRHGRQSREQLVGRTMPEVYPGIEHSEVFQAIQRVLAGAGPESITNRFVYPDGSAGWFELSLQPVPEGVFILSIDISERVKAQSVASRAQRLESLGTLAGGVAHDLNNALAPVLITTEMLRESGSLADDDLATIAECTQRAIDLVRQLLIFARGSDGQRISVAPAEVLRQLERMVQSTFPKEIDARFRYASELPALYGDPTQLHQVLLNLCVNARDAMPDGGRLTIEADVVDVDETYASAVVDGRAGRFLSIAVRDSGDGIAPDILERIFEPFFTTKGPDKGTGLGLSTSLGIVRSHNGFVHVYSEVGDGTTFRVFFPLADSSANAAARPATELRGDGRGVLVVDDDAKVRLAASSALAALGFTPFTAGDGAEGLVCVAQHHAELAAVVLDLHMPTMDGPTFLARLREVMPEVPVVIASGHLDTPPAAMDGLTAAARRLAKPFTQADLEAALRDVLSAAG